MMNRFQVFLSNSTCAATPGRAGSAGRAQDVSRGCDDEVSAVRLGINIGVFRCTRTLRRWIAWLTPAPLSLEVLLSLSPLLR